MRTVGEYCDESGFMMTSQVGRSIVREAEITKLYSDENLYITGILRNDEIIDRLIEARYYKKSQRRFPFLPKTVLGILGVFRNFIA